MVALFLPFLFFVSYLCFKINLKIEAYETNDVTNVLMGCDDNGDGRLDLRHCSLYRQPTLLLHDSWDSENVVQWFSYSNRHLWWWRDMGRHGWYLCGLPQELQWSSDAYNLNGWHCTDPDIEINNWKELAIKSVILKKSLLLQKIRLTMNVVAKFFLSLWRGG